MLLAYIDEIGHTGAFVHPTHKRFADSPAFGYGGFLIPESRAREFGAIFANSKKQLFRDEVPEGEDPNRWEKKGADLLYARVELERPKNLRVLGSLISHLRDCDGQLFYFAAEKPVGTPKETNTGKEEFAEREIYAMRESLNRLARAADYKDESILVMMDQVNEKSRRQRLPEMYSHILGRASAHDEMRRIIEPPMHIDSELSANIQFADWVCALVKRAIEYQLVEDSRYKWVPHAGQLKAAYGAFTHESKLKLCKRDIEDIHHAHIMYAQRPCIDYSSSMTLTNQNRQKLEQVRRASFKA